MVARKNTRLEPRLSLILEVVSFLHLYIITNLGLYKILGGDVNKMKLVEALLDVRMKGVLLTRRTAAVLS